MKSLSYLNNTSVLIIVQIYYNAIVPFSFSYFVSDTEIRLIFFI